MISATPGYEIGHNGAARKGGRLNKKFRVTYLFNLFLETHLCFTMDTTRDCNLLYWGFGFLTPSFFMRPRRVLTCIPKVDAALFSPPIFQFLASRTRRI